MKRQKKLIQYCVDAINSKIFEMKKLFVVILPISLLALTSLNVIAQNPDCIETDSSQKKLYLNGNNFTLIDNALRCFKLNSVAEDGDTLVRIWILDSDFPDTPTTWRVQMFEFGKKLKIPFAKLHLLEWGFESDSSLPVKCIKQIRMSPKEGWLPFEKDIRRLKLPELYKKPFINKGIVMTDFGMLIIQFLFGHTTYTVDFTGLVNVSNPVNTLQFDHSRRITYLLWFIEKSFSVRLSVDLKGRDFLEESMMHLNLRK